VEPAVDHGLQITDVCGCQCWRQVGGDQSTRYPGAMPCWHLHTTILG